MARQTNKQKMFIEYYLQSFNAADAARKAGYSKDTAYQIGAENLTKPVIKAAISEKMTAVAMDTNEVLGRLAVQARGSMAPFIEVTNEGFGYLSFESDEAKDSMHLIKSINTKRTRRVIGSGDHAEQWEDEYVKVDLVDTQAALLALGKHHKLFTDQVDHNFRLNVDGVDEALDKVYGQFGKKNKG